MTTSIVRVAPDRLNFELSLAKKFTEQIGFLPKPAMLKYAEHHGVYRAHENHEPCGFVVASFDVPSNPATCRIYQACIAHDAQRRRHGLALIDHVCQIARARGLATATCWCLEDLPANLFWRDAGFTDIGLTTGGSKRRANLIGWARPLDGRTISESDAQTFRALTRRRLPDRYKNDRLHQLELFAGDQETNAAAAAAFGS